jgi:hypothetical protein
VQQHVLENSQSMQAQPEPATEVEVIPRSGAPVEDSAAAGPETAVEESAAVLVEDSAAAGPEVPIEDSASAGQNAPVKDSAAAVLDVPAEDCTAAVLDVPAEDSTARPDAAPEPSVAAPTLPAVAAGSNNNGGNLQMHAVDNAIVPVPLAAQDATTPASTTEQKPIPVPLAAQDATTPAATTERKPTRRHFTQLLLKNILDEEGGTPHESQVTPQHSKDASIDSALLPQRRFTRSQLKTKVESGLVGSEDVPGGASDSPPSVKKMEMKMSKKVALLTKHPGNIRELFNTGLLEETPVMYIIPHSKV